MGLCDYFLFRTQLVQKLDYNKKFHLFLDISTGGKVFGALNQRVSKLLDSLYTIQSIPVNFWAKIYIMQINFQHPWDKLPQK